MDINALVQMLQQALSGRMGYAGGPGFQENMGPIGTQPPQAGYQNNGQQPPWMQFLQQMFQQPQGRQPLQGSSGQPSLGTSFQGMSDKVGQPLNPPRVAYAGGSPTFRENVGAYSPPPGMASAPPPRQAQPFNANAGPSIGRYGAF